MNADIGLGLAALGRPEYMNLGHAQDFAGASSVEDMRRHCWQMLDLAWQAGIRHFDAARSYGRAEEFLAGWLRSSDRPDVLVSSKWGYIYTANWRPQPERHEVKEHNIDNLRRQWNESNAWLGPRLQLYQIHSATLQSGVLEDREILGFLRGLQQNGLRIGLSLSGVEQSETLRRARQIAFDGRPLFDSVQATYNLLETSAGPALAEAHAAGMQVIVKEGLANGRLTSRNQLTEDQNAIEHLRAFATERETGIDAIGLAYVLSQPWVDVALSGAATAMQLRSNLEALQFRHDPELGALASATGQRAEQYWQTRAALPWQ
ncbi:MAG: aldo/keto reductase [Leptospirales bacterium]|nr:aldo/keto reductase [Leptospirales bacterium]